MTFNGQDLLNLIEEILDQEDDLRNRLISGMGFRGKIFGEFVFKGLTFNVETQEWLTDDGPIESQRTYRIAAVDHYWFLPFFPTIADYGAPELLFPDFIRHSVADYLRKRYPLTDTGKD